MPSTFLEQWLDSSVKPLDNFDPDTYLEEQQQRLIRNAAVAQVAYDFPRRLGATASSDELARDKRVSKRLRNRYLMIMSLWDTQPADMEEYINDNHDVLLQMAATLEWAPALGDSFDSLRREIRLLASTGLLQEGRPHKKICNKFANRLISEIFQINQVFREVYPEARYELNNPEN